MANKAFYAPCGRAKPTGCLHEMGGHEIHRQPSGLGRLSCSARIRIESINQATQLYILAGHILGPRPMMIPKRGKIKPQTYLSLLDKWDAFGNAMVELELAAPFQ